MRISIKKKPSLISIYFKDGEYSHNLFCSNLVLTMSTPKQIESDFESIIRSNALQNSNEDLDYLFKHSKDLDTIRFQDPTIFKAITRHFTQNESFILKILGKKPIDLDASVQIESGNELIITCH